MLKNFRLQISPERAQQVVSEISVGSEPQGRFYALLIVSAMIASFGLLANSAAVIIGAMLVSPLMMPIFGIALGMLRGDARLFWQAMIAEVVGVALAVGSAWLFGVAMLNMNAEASPEMLARTQPHLFDLLVAVFAGFAGAYALVDERISPALPGVAIATAIVPPLSTVGLCLAMGAYAGAGGAMLLFLANFVSILLVALLTFTATGFVAIPKWKSPRKLAMRFGPTLVGFVVIAVILTGSFLRISRERYQNRQIRSVLNAELASGGPGALEEFAHHAHDGTLDVLATVRAPDVVSPGEVERMQKRLSETLATPTRLVVRTVLAKDVSATGSTVAVTKPNLNGVFFSSQISGRRARIKLAEQVLLEQLLGEPGMRVVDVMYGDWHDQGLVVAGVETIRAFTQEEIRRMEAALRERLEDPDLRLVVRAMPSDLVDSDGRIQIGWSNLDDATAEDMAERTEWERVICDRVRATDRVLPVGVNFNVKDGKWRALVEVVGPRNLSPGDVARMQREISRKLKRPMEINLWYRTDYVVTKNHLESYEEFTKATLEERIRTLPVLFR